MGMMDNSWGLPKLFLSFFRGDFRKTKQKNASQHITQSLLLPTDCLSKRILFTTPFQIDILSRKREKNSKSFQTKRCCTKRSTFSIYLIY